MTSIAPGSLVCVNKQCSVVGFPTTKLACSACRQSTQPAVTSGVKVSMPPSSSSSAGKVVDTASRTLFGGFWTIVTIVAFIGGVTMVGHGNMGGLLTIGFSILTGFYARYIFRGGRFRFLFW